MNNGHQSNLSNDTSVNHPKHYGGENNPTEAIKVIEAWGLGFNLGNTVKYISRAGKKDSSKELEDLKKALWYLEREITIRQTEEDVKDVLERFPDLDTTTPNALLSHPMQPQSPMSQDGFILRSMLLGEGTY